MSHKQVRNFDKERLEATIKMVSNEDSWPGWPVLPLKNTHNHKLGLLFTGHPNRVFEGNIFSLPGDLTTLPNQTYSSAQDMMLDGWRVD